MMRTRIQTNWIFNIVVALSLIGCGTVVGNPDDEDDNPVVIANESMEEENQVDDSVIVSSQQTVSNTISEGYSRVKGSLTTSLTLTDTTTITHVGAYSSNENRWVIAEVETASDATKSFQLELANDQPWVLVYIDSTKTGAEMVVSRFAYQGLDTMIPQENQSDIDLGEVNADSSIATVSLPYADLLEGFGVSEEAAATFAILDDVSLRYLNPDIDTDGEIDGLSQRSFLLDFHNRFASLDANGNRLDLAATKNQFPDIATYSYEGSGIIPEIEPHVFDNIEPDTYTWRFTSSTLLNNDSCEGFSSGDILSAETTCVQDFSGVSTLGRYQLGLEVIQPPEGTYQLSASGKTLTWTDVAVSDYSVGEGFLALQIHCVVDTDEKLRAVKFRWMKKSSSGLTLATQEEIELIAKANGGTVSFKVDGSHSGKSLTVQLARLPEGEVVLLEHLENSDLVGGDGISAAEIESGIDWNRVQENIGVSYDDKLGMRFFFGYY